MTGETGLRVPRGRLRTPDSTLSGSAVSVHVRGRATERNNRHGCIDTLLTLACGRTYRVDEKIRTPDWPDVLLERQ
jgi:hypothetical protein